MMTGDLYFHLARIISNSWEIMSLMEVSLLWDLFRHELQDYKRRLD